MIIATFWTEPGGLARHLAMFGLDANESVFVRADLSIDAFGDIEEDLRNFSAMSLSAGKLRALIHGIFSPTEQLTPEQERSMLLRLRSAYGIPDSHPMLVVMHMKVSEERDCPHYHIVMPAVLPNGRLIRDSHSKIKNERVARTLEIEFGQKRVVGAHNKAVHAYLDREQPDIAPLVDPYARPRRSAARTLNEKQQAERYRVDAKTVDAEVLRIYRQSNGSMKTFAALLDKAGFTVGRGKSAVLVIHENSGFYGSLSRVINRAAKAAKVDLKLSAESFEAAFGRAEAFEVARANGFVRARKRAEATLGREVAKAVFEAGADGDLNRADAEKARLQTHLEQSTNRFARAASIRAIQDAIFNLYRQRDAARRRRVDRAFRTAGLVKTRGYARRAFQLAAGVTLLTGAGLAFALGVGVVAAGAALVHQGTAFTYAQDLAETSAKDRKKDLALARRAAAELAKPSSQSAPGPAETSNVQSSGKQQRGPVASSEEKQAASIVPAFSFDRIDRLDRALVGFYAQLILSKRRPNLTSSIGLALGEPLATDIRLFLASSSNNQQAVISGWFKDNEKKMHEASAALYRRGQHAVAKQLRADVGHRIKAGPGLEL